MASKTLFFVCLVVLFTIIDNAHADWNLKFWKSKTTTTTTTVAPSTQVPSVQIGSNSPNGNSPITNPGNPDRTRPRQPNPGTEVGLDISGPKPNPAGINTHPGQGYREWAVDLTGAGEQNSNQLPKLTTTGPTLSSGHSSQPTLPSNKPVTSFPQVKVTETTPRLATTQNSIHNRSPIVASTTTKSTPIPSRPADSTQNNPKPVIIQTPISSGGKSWAQVAGGSKSPSSTTTPRPNSGQNKIYSSNPTFSKGNTVTDEDLEKLSEALFIKDSNNAFKHIQLNLQKQTSSSSSKDEAPEPLLTVNSVALQIPTIQRVIAIYDNYQLDPKVHEYISPSQREEESLLVDTFLSTNVMSMAMRFLADKGFVRKDYYEYKDTLRRLWFNLYSRGEGKIGSTGFEHVFLTEVKLGTEVSGLHNWIYFNAEEVKKRADYLGYIKKVDLGENAVILKLHAKFNGVDKPVTTMFIGTSPELEMALYTVCYFARPDSSCPVSLGGTKFNIQTYKFKYRGKELIGSAYPEI
ncbi:poly(U)-specific endoribonuclease homolog [Chelonus insularis]|uniref:poly(U)-specific endoribonuclease homolog n=1 Tax=Chelonus insularis TaxID=460826 RepID=UPI00158DF61E|nr:poly(U)-specific endoribonuclease homolog [Chelonus insularis]